MNPFPIGYASRPRLRGRLTLGRLTLPRKPQVFGGRVFHPSFRYSYRHSHFCRLQRPSRDTFISRQNAPLPSAANTQRENTQNARWRRTRDFGGELEPRYIVGAQVLNQ